MKNSFRKLVNKVLLPHSQLTYAQCGEDLILASLFFKLSIDKPSYLDIGANHPSYISNTYYFYLRGSTGVCVEPNPYLSKKIRKLRKGDLVLNVGVGFDEQTEGDFYLFPKRAHGLSTFSKEEAEYWGSTGMKKVGKIQYEKILRLPLININTIMEKYFRAIPDFISIDVEGLDLSILQSLDFNRYAPKVVIVETLKYDTDQNEYKNSKIIDFMVGKGYQPYADTHVNTIFFKH
ncbi:MAG: FkbM family methyltransferase [Ginsengibacter sp.]